MRLTFVSFAILCSLCASAFAISAEGLGSAVVDATLSYDISVPQGATEVKFYGYAFPNTTAQVASFTASDPYSLSTDEFGNSILLFTYDPRKNGNNPKTIIVRARLNVSYDPSSFSFGFVRSGGADYLASSRLAKVTPDIISLSNSIVSGLPPSQKAAALASWVNNKIVYDSAYKDVAYDSATTLSLGRGTCDEKSHLLEALLRAQGIPSRHAVGFVYSGTEWGPHAWTEAQLDGRWVPIDATFNEFYFLSAGHVLLAAGRDQDDTRYNLVATGISDLSDAKVVPRRNLTLVSYSGFSGFFSLQPSFPSGDFHQGQSTVVSATVTNSLSRAIAVPLSLTVSDEFYREADPETILLLGPNESGAVSWDLTFPAAMRDGFSYNYTALISGYGREWRGHLSASAAEKRAAVLLDDFSAKELDGGILLSFGVRNEADYPLAVVATVRTGNYTGQVPVGPIPPKSSETAQFSIPLPAAWRQSLSGNITAEYSGGRAAQQFHIDLSAPSAAPSADPNNIELTPELLVSPGFLFAVFIVIVLTFLLTIFVREYL